MRKRLETLDTVGLDVAADTLKRGFADYFVPIPFGPAMLLNMIPHDGIAPALSRLVFQNDEPIGCALIARRGWTCRLAGMAIVPEARTQGVGRWLMDELVKQARARGDRQMVLEVIAENEPALKLYESLGFVRVRRLVSLDLDAAPPEELAELESIDIREAAQIVARHGLPDLPWQLSAESLALSAPPMRAYRLGPAIAVVSDPSAKRVGVLSLVVETDARGAGHAKRLLRALFAAHPGKSWRVPALCPEEAAGPFAALGFEPGELSQWQMALDLV